ncbi:MAG: hexose kinase [Nitrospiraceae bacterium]|nr:hexose kinase [Nitrospiraceae bacterium]
MILTVTPNPCVDKTVFIDRLEPGVSTRSKRYTCVPGGKGNNVSRAVKALGRATKAMPLVGGHTGAHVVEMIEQQDGVECVPIWVDSPTRTITTVLEESIHRQTPIFEPGSHVTNEEATQIENTFRDALDGVQVVIFSGTVPDPNIKTLYRSLIPIAHNAGAATILDSHGPEFALGLEAHPHMAKPNDAEAQELVGFALETDADRWRAVEAFHARGIELVVLSLGPRGAFVSKGGIQFHAIPPAIEEINAVGSGDALVAGFAIGLLESMDLQDAARLAIAAGAANAMSWDIGHFTAKEVEALLPKMEIRER